MKFSFKKILIIFCLILGLILLVLNYIFSIKINNLFFKNVEMNNGDFINSYTPTKIKYEDIEFNIYNIPHASSTNFLFYIPSNGGISNIVLNYAISKYNLIAIEYPKDINLQNFKSLYKIAQGAMQEAEKQNATPENTIIFGHGIGANVALKLSTSQVYKHILLFNMLENEKRYCSNRFSSILCILTKSSIITKNSNSNLIYYFFNAGSIMQLEENYTLFNSINTNEKFFFEISGEDGNFNFSQIIDLALQNQTIEINEVPENSHETLEEFIENDGLFGETDKYID